MTTPFNISQSTQLSFTLENEDHTLGNALRAQLVKNPAVQFAGYSMPHPTKHEINLRIQTTNIPAIDALHQGLDDLIIICDNILKAYETESKAYDEAKEKEMAAISP